MAALGLGGLLAAYKLWPVVAWQMATPRSVGNVTESLTVADVVRNLCRFTTDFHDPKAADFANQAWFRWEYAAFVGWPALLVLALAGMCRLRLGPRAPKTSAVLPLVGLVAIACGINLALGQGNPWSIASHFGGIPLVEGIRVFGRYQILVVFGIACLVAWAIPAMAELLPAQGRKGAAWLLGAAVAGPAMLQTLVLISAIQSTNQAELAAAGPLPRLGPVPLLAHKASDGSTNQTYLLDNGYWVSNCYEPLSVVRPTLAAAIAPLSEPAPSSIVDLGSDSLTLGYDAAPGGQLHLNLGDASHVQVSVPPGQPTQLTLQRPLTAWRCGAWASFAGAVATAILAFWLRRRGGRG
jgi:hypothetical protein